MSLRSILLRLMLAAFGLCVLPACLLLTSGRPDVVLLVSGSVTVSLLAIAVLYPVSLLIEIPRFRFAGINIAGLVAMLWAMAICQLWFGWPLLLGLGSNVFLFGIPATAAMLVYPYPPLRVAAVTLTITSGIGLLTSIVLRYVASLSSFAFSIGILGDPGVIDPLGLYTAFLGLVASCLLVNVGQRDRRYFRWPGILLCVAACLVAWFQFLATDHTNEEVVNFFGRIQLLLLAPALSLAHINLLLMARVAPARRWLILAAIVTSALAAFLLAASANLLDPSVLDTAFPFRLGILGALFSAAASAAVTLLGIARLRGEPAPGTASTLDRLSLQCPHCLSTQQIPLGPRGSSCPNCSLHIRVTVTEPHCEHCGYLLYSLAADRCPECGNPVKPPSPPPQSSHPLPLGDIPTFK